ncbi:MAG TPA: hypothetical protein EYP10_00195, partial [Armatimonadetes bacterium]|nr:hypothetical protein [Armatimonadota bacterium]
WIRKLKAMLNSLGVMNVTVISKYGTWIQMRKPQPPNIDEWTHHLHGPDGNPVANDRVVGPPKHLQWLAEPVWSRSHDTDSSVCAVVTSRGRIFYIVDEAPISLPGDHPLPDNWFLVARDAFNGVLLWKVPMKRWGWREWKHTWYKRRPWNMPLNLPRRLVAFNDRVYVTLGYHAPVTELDARTGAVLQTYEGTEDTREILLCKGVLILTVYRNGSLKVVAVDVDKGRILWESKNTYKGSTMEYVTRVGFTNVDPVLNTATNGRVICLVDGADIVCLDFNTGKELWRTKIANKVGSLWIGTLIVHDKVVLYAEPTQLVGLSVETGRKLWSRTLREYGWLWFQWKDIFVINGLVWTWSYEAGKRERGGAGVRVYPLYADGIDPLTGVVKRRVPLG